jgi:hypothetical protein
MEVMSPVQSKHKKMKRSDISMQEKKDAVVIQIKIEASALVEAIESLATTILDVFEYKLMEKCSVIGNKIEPTTENVIEAEEKTENIANVDEDKAPWEEDEKPEEPIKLEDVRAKLAALSQSGKQKEVKALIEKFGAKKLTDIPQEKYPQLLKEAEAL